MDIGGDVGDGDGDDGVGGRRGAAGYRGQAAGAHGRWLHGQVVGRIVRVPVRRQQPVPLGRRQ